VGNESVVSAGEGAQADADDEAREEGPDGGVGAAVAVYEHARAAGARVNKKRGRKANGGTGENVKFNVTKASEGRTAEGVHQTCVRAAPACGQGARRCSVVHGHRARRWAMSLVQRDP
jgi:hypothetical protein